MPPRSSTPLSDSSNGSRSGFPPVVIEAVNDIEELTANFSRKVWQKISILESYDASSARIGADGRATENGADGLGLSSQQL
jgi:hypothetical protein